jgi:hypothetical protein
MQLCLWLKINLQKYRYILENIDGDFRDFSWFVPNFALHINNIDWEVFWLFICFEDLYIWYFIKKYLATPWRVAVKYCHFLGRDVTGPDQGFPVNSNNTGTITQVNMPILAWSQPCKEIALLKGLRRVSRSESFIFSTKLSKKSRFSSKDFFFKNPYTIYLIVRTALHLTTAKVWRVSGLFS